MAQLTNLAFFRAAAGQADALGAALTALVAPTRQEAGCLTYDLHRSLAAPWVWLVYETWASAESLAAHLRSAHVQAFLTTASVLLDGDIEQRAFAMISSPAAARPVA